MSYYSLGAAAGAVLRAASSWVAPEKEAPVDEDCLMRMDEMLDAIQEVEEDELDDVEEALESEMKMPIFNSSKPINVIKVRSLVGSYVAPIRKWSVETVETFAGEDEGELPEISLKEVARHSRRNDAWMVIYDKVYDVTQFLIQVSYYFTNHQSPSTLQIEQYFTFVYSAFSFFIFFLFFLFFFFFLKKSSFRLKSNTITFYVP